MTRTTKTYYWFTLPAVALFLVFHTFPALQGVFYSFTNSRGFGTWEFVGFENYARLFSDPLIRQTYGFTFGVAIVATILTNVISLAIAVGLTAVRGVRSFLRGIYFLPAVIATLVISYVFNFLFAHAFPDIGRSLGVEALSKNILGDSSLAWIGIVIVVVWQGCATTIVIYMAGIQTVPVDVQEAAIVDGADAWTRFWKITFPLLAPFFTINMVLSLKNYLMIFDQIVGLTGGGPGTATTSISFLIFKNGFSGGQFAYQSANAVIYFIAISLVSIVQLGILRKREVSA